MFVIINKFMLDMRKRCSAGSDQATPTYIARLIIRLLVIVMVLFIVRYLYSQLAECKCPINEDPNDTRRHFHHGHYDGRKRHKRTVESVYWKAPVVPDYINTLQQDDPRLIEHIRKYWIVPPFTGKPVLSNPSRVDRSQAGQALCVDHLSGTKSGGFFVEAGAANGETFSNTLYLERYRNWTGLLVEPNPEYFSELLGKRRNAFMINACLSPTNMPMTLNFSMAKLMGALEDYLDEGQLEVIRKPKRYTRTIEVQCFPAYSILKALNVSHVDYVSLDVEGPEYLILDTIPLDLLHVDIFSVEYRVAKSKDASQRKFDKIFNILEAYGYHFAGKMMRLDVILQKGLKKKQDPICFPQRTKSF